MLCLKPSDRIYIDAPAVEQLRSLGQSGVIHNISNVKAGISFH